MFAGAKRKQQKWDRQLLTVSGTDCRANIFSGNLSRNSCIKESVIPTKMEFSRAFFRQSFSQDPASIN